MTLTSTLQAMPNLVLVSLNFSSSTDPNLILQVILYHSAATYSCARVWSMTCMLTIDFSVLTSASFGIIWLDLSSVARF